MHTTLRQLFAPALLTVALMPLAFSAHANHHNSAGIDREAMQERMEERRQDVYQRAGLSEERQTALNEAHAEYREAMLSLREDHQAKVAEILTEDEQQALRNAMHDMHAEKHNERRRHHGESAEKSAAE